eukprot:TRINITY_DN9331_c0_g1_i1.p1 TRINITY_DN9331_c0_g1~~TRINITY_DN9331_c0_g1_i1.p1  ORF type:complete len:215 (+),score=25.63 TRINITY_DN9331_c0_g1_i1:35-679(+)
MPRSPRAAKRWDSARLRLVFLISCASKPPIKYSLCMHACALQPPPQGCTATQGPEDVHPLFVNRLKEANYIKYHRLDMEVVRNRSSTNKLWSALLHDDYDKYSAASVELQGDASVWYNSIPFMAYVVSRQSDQVTIKETIQEPFPTSDDDGVAWTLRDLLIWLLPDVFVGTAPTGIDERVLIHGVSPPLDTPVQWLAQHLPYPDSFVHMILLID